MHGVAGLLLALSMNQAAASTATGRLSGRVTAESTSMPIAGARIVVFPIGRPGRPIAMPPQTTTDQDGRFAFDNLPPGEYRLDVQKTGFAAPQDPTARPRAFTVVAGQSLDNVNFQLQKGAVISGRVLDEKGEPVTDARVMAMRRVNAPAATGAPARFIPAPMQGPQQTNDLGEYRVTGLAPGEYRVAAVPRGTSPVGGAGITSSGGGGAPTAMTTTFYPGTADQADAQAITVAAGAEVSNIVFMMQSAPAFRVSGIVVDENGGPVSRAMVMLMADPRAGGVFLGPGGGAQSGEDGRFVIGEVTAGSYRVTASILRIGTSAGGSGGGSFTSFSSGFIGGVAGGVVMDQPLQIAVVDGDVEGVRVVVRRPSNPQ